MDPAMTDRRSEPRIPAAGLHIDHATLRPGCPVDVVDLSPTGVQVQSVRPLRPGSRVHVRLASKNRTLAVAAHVVRCVVWSLHLEEGVTYRAALRFEEACQSFWEEQTRSGYQIVVPPL
jgi:hypothetical protein